MTFDRVQLGLPGDHQLRPHPNCYWLLPGLILAGEYPRTKDQAQSRAKLLGIVDAGVREFYDLTEITELEPYAGMLAEVGAIRGVSLRHSRHAIRDVSIPTQDLMRTILDEIHGAVAQGRSVYLHCWGGIGRTGTVAGCLLVEAGYTAEEAIGLLAAKWKVVEKSAFRPHSPETREQFEFIREWRRLSPHSGQSRLTLKERT